MAELPRVFFERRVTRGRTTGQLGSLPAQPRIDATWATAPARALGSVSQGFEALGLALADAERSFARAGDDVKGAEAFSQAVHAIEESRDTVLNDQAVFPLDRADVFRDQVTPTIEQLAGSLPQRVQGPFRQQATRYLAQIDRELRTSGRRDFVARGVKSLDLTLQQLQSAFLRADNETDRAQLRQSMQEITGIYTTNGILSAADAETALRGLRQAAQLVDADRAIRANPAEAVRQLRQLLAGQSDGVSPVFGQVDPARLPELFDRAQAEHREVLSVADQDEARAERQIALGQEAAASQLITRLNDPEASLGDYRQIIADANTLVGSRGISGAQHDSVTSRARSFLEKKITTGVVSNPSALKSLSLDVYGPAQSGQDYDTLRRRIEAQIAADEVSLDDGTPLLQEVEARRNRTYYANDPTYEEGVRILRQGISLMTLTASTAANRRQQQDLKFRTAQALEHYARMMREVWQGQGRQGVQDQALDVARRVRNLYRLNPVDVVDSLPPSPYLQGVQGATLQERFDAAYQALSQDRSLAPAERRMHFEYLELHEQIEESKQPAATPGRAAPGQLTPEESWFDRLLKKLGGKDR